MAGTELHERVVNDPGLTGIEKETGITISGREDMARIDSSQRTVVKSLLRHELFKPDWFNVRTSNGVMRIDVDDMEGHDGAIVGLSGHIPVGSITIKSTKRSNDNVSSVVNWEIIDPDAFG